MRQTNGFSHRSSAKPTLKGKLAALFPLGKCNTSLTQPQGLNTLAPYSSRATYRIIAYILRTYSEQAPVCVLEYRTAATAALGSHPTCGGATCRIRTDDPLFTKQVL